MSNRDLLSRGIELPPDKLKTLALYFVKEIEYV